MTSCVLPLRSGGSCLRTSTNPFPSEIVPLSASSRGYSEGDSLVLGWQLGTLPLRPKEPSHHDTPTSTREPSSARPGSAPARPRRGERRAPTAGLPRHRRGGRPPRSDRLVRLLCRRRLQAPSPRPDAQDRL